MEVYHSLNEVVGFLLDQGYLIDFNCSYESSFKEISTPGDFKIDSLYMVKDEQENGQNLLVAAISSKALATKIILINALVQNDDQLMLGQRYYWIKRYLIGLIKKYNPF